MIFKDGKLELNQWGTELPLNSFIFYFLRGERWNINLDIAESAVAFLGLYFNCVALEAVNVDRGIWRQHHMQIYKQTKYNKIKLHVIDKD